MVFQVPFSPMTSKKLRLLLRDSVSGMHSSISSLTLIVTSLQEESKVLASEEKPTSMDYSMLVTGKPSSADHSELILT